MSKHTTAGTTEAREEGLERLAETLPADIDRRTFFKTAVAGTFVGLAGCAGGGTVDEELEFRIAVDPSPNYAIAFAAQHQGFWEDQDITPLTVRGGQGSGDTTRRVATNEDSLGLAAVTPQMLGIAQDDYDIKQLCMTKARAQSGLIYRADMINDPYDPADLTGQRITAPDTLDEQMWDIFREGVGAGDVEVEYAEGATAASMLDQGDIAAIWDSINDYASLQENLDHELGFAPLYTITPMAGYAMIVNGSWIEETDGGVDYVTRVVQGYSEAGKWTLLNPEAAVSMMEEEFQAISTQPTESNLAALAAGVAATNLSDGTRQNGFGYLDEDVIQNTFDHLSTIYDVEAPSVGDVVHQEVRENAELAQFSDSEWSQVEEFAGEFADFYER